MLSSWAESYIAALQVMEGSAPDAAAQAKQQLEASLASAGKPGAPRDALPLTLRALGFGHASTGQLDQAAAAYARAQTTRMEMR